jgi:hypothetical protein
MQKMSKLLVVIAVLAAAGYAFHRVQTCRFVLTSQAEDISSADQPKAQGGAVVTAQQQSGIGLLYPSPFIEQSFKLGYATFQSEADGGWQAVPLPPGTALQVLIRVDTAGHEALFVTLPDARCQAGVEVVAWRPDQNKPVVQALLKKRSQAVDIPLAGISPSLIMGLRMPEGAANNWFCNVHASWHKAP